MLPDIEMCDSSPEAPAAGDGARSARYWHSAVFDWSNQGGLGKSSMERDAITRAR